MEAKHIHVVIGRLLDIANRNLRNCLGKVRKHHLQPTPICHYAHRQGNRFPALSSDSGNSDSVLLLHGFRPLADAWRPIPPSLTAVGRHTVAVHQGVVAGRRRHHSFNENIRRQNLWDRLS